MYRERHVVHRRFLRRESGFMLFLAALFIQGTVSRLMADDQDWFSGMVFAAFALLFGFVGVRDYWRERRFRRFRKQAG